MQPPRSRRYAATARRILALALPVAFALASTLADAGAPLRPADALPEQNRNRDPGVESMPALTRASALIIHDHDASREHLIQTLEFRRLERPFGWVLPTPTQPEVAELSGSPFARLRGGFGFHPRPRQEPREESEGVEVAAISKLGDVTAFVLAADDAEALGRWLAANELVAGPQTEAWLARYVELGFWFVALRVDPAAAGEGDAVVSETVRVSFSTPLPYYPYREPVGASSGPRLLELWYVGRDPVVPIAVRERDGVAAWVQPVQRGRQYRNAEVLLPAALGPELRELVPDGPLIVQTYQDQKSSRAGFGELVFGLSEGIERTPELEAELAPLLGLLDPALAPGAPDSPQTPEGPR